jgi:hypothetical protein
MAKLVATGGKGKTFNDRELAANVRTLGLKEIEKILKRTEMDEFKKAVILRIAPSLLPRLNEHTGEDGGPVKITGVDILVRQ